MSTNWNIEDSHPHIYTLVMVIVKERLFATICNILDDERGQDLIEYTLLLAFVALASAALFTSAGSSVSTIWGAANTNLGNAASQAS